MASPLRPAVRGTADHAHQQGPRAHPRAPEVPCRPGPGRRRAAAGPGRGPLPGPSTPPRRKPCGPPSRRAGAPRPGTCGPPWTCRSSAAEQRFAHEVRTWLDAHVEHAPDTDDIAASVAWGRRWQATLAAAGWVGIDWPVAFGGRGASAVEVAIFNAEYARSGAAQLVNRVGINLAGPTLLAHGTSGQCRAMAARPSRPPTRSGASCSASRGRGRTWRGWPPSARPVDGGWLVSGQKVWTSYAQFARFGPVPGAQRGRAPPARAGPVAARRGHGRPGRGHPSRSCR